MRSLRKQLALAGLLWLAATAGAERAQAQVLWGGEYDRYFRPGPYVPSDGATYTQQYGYIPGQAFIYPFSGGVGASRLWALDHEDRVARALKFGYAVPADTPPPPRPAWRPFFGLGFGIFSGR